MAIDIGYGSPAGNGDAGTGVTWISNENAANASGTITSVTIRVSTQGNFHVGIFYNTSGDNFKCRSAVDLGTLAAGEQETTGLDLAVETGDVIGLYGSDSGVARNQGGGDAGDNYSVAGNKCVVDDESTYFSGTNHICIQGAGVEDSGALAGTSISLISMGVI